MQRIDYQQRLAQAAKRLDGAAMLLVAQPQFYRNADTRNAYRQHSSVYYLTGVEEPETALLIAPYREEGDRLHLFVRPKDALAELWSGRRMGKEEAERLLPFDRVHLVEDLYSVSVDLLEGANGLYCELGATDARDRELLDLVMRHRRKYGRKAGSALLPILDAGGVMGDLRLYKSDAEVERMRQAAKVTTAAFDLLYKEVRPGWNERQVHGLLVGAFLQHGGEMEAYPSIVAGGGNACCLHYEENRAPLGDGDVLLIDAGAQYQYYASDVTRTIPVGKQFTPRQRDLYQLCLRAQTESLAVCVPGKSIPDVHRKTSEVIAQGLIDLQLLKGSVDEAIDSGAIKRFFPHGTSHWIGLDVHDPCPYYADGEPLPFKKGMYFSLEPGIYIQPDDEEAPEEWRGIGIRIEDDILITSDGHENITAAIPKQLDEVENRF